MKLLFIVSFVYSNNQCKTPILRKNIELATDLEIKKYIDAVLELNKRPKKGLSIHQNFIKTHILNGNKTHGTALFLPWHRYFIKLYELELQKIDKNVTLMYWDWSKDTKNPKNSKIFNKNTFGTNGNNNNNCLTDGKFKNWKLFFNGKCLQRHFNFDKKIGSFANSEVLINMIRNTNSFNDFHKELEEWHGDPHLKIGGNLKGMTSTLDPIFMLLHTFIDLLWAEWQKQHSKEEQYIGFDEKSKKNITKLDIIYPFNIEVKEVLNTTNDLLCYDYPSFDLTLNSNTENEKLFLKAMKTSDLLNDTSLLNKASNEIVKFGKNDYVNSKDLLLNVAPLSPNWSSMNEEHLQLSIERREKANYLINLLNEMGYKSTYTK